MAPITAPLSTLASAAGHGLRAGGATALAMASDLVGGRDDDPLEARDPSFIAETLPAYRGLLWPYFRPKVKGLDLIPAEGPSLLVGNHSGGTLIVDTFAFTYEFYEHFGPERRFHQLAHDLAVQMPALAALLRKYGTLPAGHEHASRALRAGAPVLVYPGGDHETYRPSWRAGEIQFGGRKGWIRLALAEDVPIAPVVAAGGQETALFLTRGARAARLFGLDRMLRLKVLPLQLGPPFGLTVLDLPGRIPLPSQITVQVLPPIHLREQFGPDPSVDEVYEHVTAEMQRALDELEAERNLPVAGSVTPRSDRSDVAAEAAAERRGRR